MASDRAISRTSENLTAAERDAVDDGDTFRPVAAWFSVVILIIFSFFSFLDRQIISLLVEPIKHDLALSDTQVGLLQGIAFAAFYALAGLPIGLMIDRFSRRKMLYIGVTLWSLSCMYCGLARNFWQLWIGRSLVGVGEATMAPGAVSLISDLFPKDRVATPLGFYASSFYVGSGLALVIGGWLVGLFAGQTVVNLPLVGAVAPWQAVFVFAGLPGFVAAFLAFFIRDKRRSSKSITRSDAELTTGGFFAFVSARRKILAFTWIGYSFPTFVSYSTGAWTPTYFMRVFGWSAAEVGWLYGLVIGIGGGGGAFLGGIVMDRIYRSGGHDSYFLTASVCAMISAPALTFAFLVPSPTMALVLLGIGLTLMGPMGSACYSTLQQIAPPAFRGRVTAIYVLIASFAGTGLGPVAVGLLTDRVFGDEMMVGYSIAVLMAIVLPLMAIVCNAGRRHLSALADDG